MIESVFNDEHNDSSKGLRDIPKLPEYSALSSDNWYLYGGNVLPFRFNDEKRKIFYKCNEATMFNILHLESQNGRLRPSDLSIEEFDVLANEDSIPLLKEDVSSCNLLHEKRMMVLVNCLYRKDNTLRYHEKESSYYFGIICILMAKINISGVKTAYEWRALGQKFPNFPYMNTSDKNRSDVLRMGHFLIRYPDYIPVLLKRFSKSKIMVFIRLAFSSYTVADIVIEEEITLPESERPSRLSCRDLEFYMRSLANKLGVATGRKKDLKRASPDNNQPSINKKFKDFTTEMSSIREELVTEEKMLNLCYKVRQIESSLVSSVLDEANKNKNILPLYVKHARQEWPDFISVNVFGDQSDTVDAFYDHIADKNCAGLFSFGIYFNKSLKYLKKARPEYSIFADSGAYQMINNKCFLNDHSVQDLAFFYNECEFDFIVEPDIIDSDFDRGLASAIVRSKEFYKHLNPDMKTTVIRPIHGKNTKERLVYIKTLDLQMGFMAEYYALGGISVKKNNEEKEFDELRKTLSALLVYGVTRLHIFGRSSESVIKILSEFKNEFMTISFDSSSGFYEAVKLKNFLLFNEETCSIDKFSFSEKTDLFTVEKNMRIANSCNCPICRTKCLEIEGDTLRPLGQLGFEMFNDHAIAKKIFNKKATLHNIYQMKLLFQHLFHGHS